MPGCWWWGVDRLTHRGGIIFNNVTREQIVETLATEKRVEALVENIAHHALTDDLKDLCQMVYLILLEYDEAKLLDLWDNGQINFFLARIIINQYRSCNSPYHTVYRKYQERCTYLGVGGDINDDAIEKLKQR